MFPTSYRRQMLHISGRLVKYFFTGLFSFAVVLILFGSFGQIGIASFLLANCTPYLMKGFVLIVCFTFMAVVIESLA
jgi:hypothetical protein